MTKGLFPLFDADWWAVLSSEWKPLERLVGDLREKIDDIHAIRHYTSRHVTQRCSLEVAREKGRRSLVNTKFGCMVSRHPDRIERKTDQDGIISYRLRSCESLDEPIPPQNGTPPSAEGHGQFSQSPSPEI